MATELSVVNACLAIMGEAPLNTLSEDHAFRGAAQDILLRVHGSVLGKGWWFNRECLTLTPNPSDSLVYIPSDVVSIHPPADLQHIVQRGRVLYDVSSGTSIFPADTSLSLTVVRTLPLADIPPTVTDLIVAQTVLEFQMAYDGDQTKTRNVAAQVEAYRTAAAAENIRQARVNLVGTSYALNAVRRHYPRYR